jgi:hypothetical protein
VSDHEFRLEGADDFAALARACRRAGRGEIAKGLTKGLREGAAPLIPLIRTAAAERLPKAGGLAEAKSKAKIRVQVRTSRRNPGVAIVMPNTQPGYNEGVIRHPVFERNKAARKGAKARGDAPVPWVEQHIDGEWFDGTIVNNADRVLPALEAALDETVERIVREARS